jgi:hypothetical protein
MSHMPLLFELALHPTFSRHTQYAIGYLLPSSPLPAEGAEKVRVLSHMPYAICLKLRCETRLAIPVLLLYSLIGVYSTIRQQDHTTIRLIT